MLHEMRRGGENTDTLLRRLHDRDAEIYVLLQRVGLLLEIPGGGDRHAVDHTVACGSGNVPGNSERVGGLIPAYSLAPDEVHAPLVSEMGRREALKKHLARMCSSQQQVSK